MCMYSAIIDYGQRTWPAQLPLPTQFDWQKYMDALKAAQEFDKAAKQPDCEDPKKVKWLDTMTKRRNKLEDKLDLILEKL